MVKNAFRFKCFNNRGSILIVPDDRSVLLKVQFPTFIHIARKIRKWILPVIAWVQRAWRALSRHETFSRQRSLKFEITVLYTVILGIILVVFSGMLYFILFRSVYSELDQELELKAQNISQTITSYLDVRGDKPEAFMYALEKTIANEGKRLNRWWFTGFERQWFEKIDEMDLSRYFISVHRDDAALVMKSQNVPSSLALRIAQTIDITKTQTTHFRKLPFQERNIRFISYPFKDQHGKQYFIEVGVYQKHLMDLVFNWLHSIMISIPLFLLITLSIGRLLVRKILNPVNQVASTARNISQGDLSLRVDLKKPYVEMTSLIEDFNAMIDKLEKSFHHIENFSAHVAHELKTPLTIMKGEAELALMNNREPEEYQQALNVNVEEVDKLLKIVEDLLLLTKLNYQPDVFQLEKIDYRSYFTEIFEQSRLLAQKKAITLTTNTLKRKIFLKADSIHLRRLFYNIIDNAIKFTPSGGAIEINQRLGRRYLFISVKDSGPGISQEDLPKIFDRFYRSETKAAGCGLGLSIAQSIALVHGGRIEVSSQPPSGSVFTIILPTLKSRR